MMQLVTALIAFLLPALLTAFLLNRKPMLLLGFARRINWKQVAVVIAIMVTALFVSAFLSYVNERIPLSADLKEWFDKLENDYNRQVQAILGLNNAWEFVVAIVVMAFLPALCEEALFRGGLQNFLTRATRLPWLSIILVSLIFSIAHFSFYGLLSRLFLGIVLGLIYHYSGRLWLCIIAHFINNALAITVLYFYKQKGVSLEQAIAESNSTWIGVFALPVLIALILLFIRLADRRWMKDLA
jgi:membrane protease YdiL (CAAX protease family)